MSYDGATVLQPGQQRETLSQNKCKNKNTKVSYLEHRNLSQPGDDLGSLLNKVTSELGTEAQEGEGVPGRSTGKTESTRQ